MLRGTTLLAWIQIQTAHGFALSGEPGMGYSIHPRSLPFVRAAGEFGLMRSAGAAPAHTLAPARWQMTYYSW
jgi:hypothetical protein